MEITGKIIKRIDITSGTRSDGTSWIKMSYLLETEGQYPRRCVFDVWSDKVNVQEGKSYRVSLDINAREYKGNWYNDIRAWRAVPLDKESDKPEPPQAEVPMPNVAPPAPADELPF